MPSATKIDVPYELLKQLIDAPRRYSSILEVGCFRGTRTVALAKELDYSATFLDISCHALQYTMKNAEVADITAAFVVSDALALPFRAESFDVVWSGGVNEHFNGHRRQLIFDEMARVCKLGGQVIVIVPNRLSIFYWLWRRALELRGKWCYDPEIPFSIFELKRRLKNAGVTPVKVRGMRTLVSPPLRSATLKVDKALGTVGGITGFEIGIMGIKTQEVPLT